MGGLPHGRVVHVQVTTNGSHHDFPGIQPNADVDRYALRALDLSGVMLDRLLHAQRRIAGPYGMILVGEGRPEQRHNAIAHHLVDGAFIAMHGLHHAFQHRIKELAGLLGIAIGQQFHRPFEVSKQDRDQLALAF